ncbi:MAG: hypothetical protein SGCHY_001071 [Lobulomycetales sp.]
MAFNHLLRERDRREIDPFLAVFALLDSSSLSTPSALSREASDLVAQKNKDINSLSDELAIHRLELSQKDELITKLNQRVSNLSSENSSLLDNIKKIKEAQVSKLNDANEFIESSLKSRSNSATGTVREPLSSEYGVVKKFSAHDAEIHCIQTSRDGALIATGSQDKRLNLFDARTGSLERSLSGSMQGIMSIQFNQANDQILGTSSDNSIKIWNLNTARLAHSLTGHIGKVFTACFANSQVISGSHDRTIKVWDVARGYYSANRQVLTTSRDNSLKLVDCRMYRVVQTFTAPQFKTGLNWTKSCYSPDAVHVASGSADGSLFVWNVVTGALEKIIQAHKSPVVGVVWSPLGGNTIYSAERDQNVCVFGSPSSVQLVAN